jgi:membrane-bound ClpP family serine protease
MDMMMVMFSPVLALVLFMVYPFGTALPIYIPILFFGVFINFKMIQSMKLPVKTGLDDMIGEEVWVEEDINPEGKVQIRGEIWAATADGKRLLKGKKAKIVGARGLVLILKDSED